MTTPPRKSAGRNARPRLGRADRDELPISVTFGKKLKAAREKAGLTQAKLAELVGIPQTKLPAIEQGRTDVRISTARRFAKALGVTLRDLLPPT